MRPFYIPVLVAGVVAGSAFAPADDPSYCNARFAFCVPYPRGFSRPQESQNADGGTMRGPDGAEVRAWGSLVDPADGLDLTAFYAVETAGIRVTYHVRRPAWFIVSGIDSASGKVVYQKSVRRAIEYFGDAGTLVFQTVRITYSVAQTARYAAYCGLLGKSLQ